MKKKNRHIILTAIAVFGLTTSITYASSVVRTGETVSVAEDQSVEEDFYTAANIINISGVIDGDLIAAGGKATINGEVGGDAIIVGGSVDVHGPVGDDVRVLGAEVIIAEPVTGDLFVLGGTVNILSSASIGGDVLVFGGDVEIAAPVGGDVIGRAGAVRIDSTVTGDVTVTTNELTLGSRANIEGSLSYTSDNLVIRAQEAVVAGEVVRNDPFVEDEASEYRGIVMLVLMMSFTVLVWYLISKSTLETVVSTAVQKNVRPILIGSGVLFLAPLAAIILLISMLGSYVGIALLLLYMLLVLLAIVAMVPITGKFFLQLFNQPTEGVNLYCVGAGVLSVTLLLFVPVLGQLLLLGLFIIALGSIADVLQLALRKK